MAAFSSVVAVRHNCAKLSMAMEISSVPFLTAGFVPQLSGSLKCTMGDERIEENLLRLLQFTFSVSVQSVPFFSFFMYFTN